MFKKAIKASSKNQLSGKDKKDLKTQLLKHFHNSSVEAFFASNTKLISEKITDLKLNILVNEEEDPVFVAFVKENIYVPTLYLVAQYPDMVQAIWLKEGVEQFVLKGANVMCPGVERYPEVEKGTVIAVKNSKGVGVATGYMGDTGVEGIACTVVHYLGDKLWEYGSKMLSHVKYAEVKEAPKVQKNIQQQAEKKEVQTQISNLSLAKKQDGQVNKQKQQSEGEEQSDSQQEKQTKDQHLQQALYNAIKLFKFTKEQFPIPITTFFSKYIKPASPVPLDVSNSSYKKVSTFFQKMAERGVVELGKWKQKSGNTVAITGVDKTHQAMKQYKTTLQQLPTIQKQQFKLQKFKLVCDQKLQTYYQLTPKIQFLRQFTKDPNDKLKLFEERQLDYLITRYLSLHKIKKYNKQVEFKKNNKIVKLKKQFIDIPYLQHEEVKPIIQAQIDYHLNNYKLEQELNQTVDHVVLKEVVSVQLESFKRHIFKLAEEEVQLVDQKTGEVVILTPAQKKGKFQKIKVDAFKSHNKNVTTIKHLEPYLTPEHDEFEQLQELSHYLQLKYACGSVVRESTDGGKYEVYLQGNVYSEVIDFLTIDQGVDESVITGTNKLPKKKKK